MRIPGFTSTGSKRPEALFGVGAPVGMPVIRPLKVVPFCVTVIVAACAPCGESMVRRHAPPISADAPAPPGPAARAAGAAVIS